LKTTIFYFVNFNRPTNAYSGIRKPAVIFRGFSQLLQVSSHTIFFEIVPYSQLTIKPLLDVTPPYFANSRWLELEMK